MNAGAKGALFGAAAVVLVGGLVWGVQMGLFEGANPPPPPAAVVDQNQAGVQFTPPGTPAVSLSEWDIPPEAFGLEPAKPFPNIPDMKIDLAPRPADAAQAAVAPAPAPAPPPATVSRPARVNTAELFLSLCYAANGRRASSVSEAKRLGFIPSDAANLDSELWAYYGPEAAGFEVPTALLQLSRIRSDVGVRSNYMHSCIVKGPPSGAAGRARLEEIMRTDARRRPRRDGGDEYIYRDGPLMNSIDLGGVPERRLMEIWETNDIWQVDVDAEGATFTQVLREKIGR